MNTDSGRQQQRLELLQIYRGLAAVGVVLFHATSELIDHFAFLALGGIFSFGFSGVYLFFVLSGFILTLIHCHDFGHPGTLKSYAYKRFFRIYPVYWLVFVFFIPALITNISKGIHWPYIFQNLMLVCMTNHEQLIVVSWTLLHEILFYFAFAALILSYRFGFLLVIAWYSTIAFFAITGVGFAPPYALSRLTGIDYGIITNFLRLIANPVNLLFGAGMACYYAYKFVCISAHRELLATLALVLGTTIFALSGYAWIVATKTYNSDWSWMYPYFGMASFFLVIATASGEINTWASRQWFLLLLGDASYSIYLVHYGAMMWLVRYFGPAVAIDLHLYFAILVVASIALGIIFFLFVEKPVLIVLGRRKPQ